jgi:methylglyoxal synthase
MKNLKRIALVAHDNRKKDLIEWVEWNWEALLPHQLVCTGTTGALVEEALRRKVETEETRHAAEEPAGGARHRGTDASKDAVRVRKLKSGPLGGDQQLGGLIADGDIDVVIFLWDPMEPQPHDVDVKALLRIAVLYNIPTACNRSTADFLISSPIFTSEYAPTLTDYSAYVQRGVGMRDR